MFKHVAASERGAKDTLRELIVLHEPFMRFQEMTYQGGRNVLAIAAHLALRELWLDSEDVCCSTVKLLRPRLLQIWPAVPIYAGASERFGKRLDGCDSASQVKVALTYLGMKD